MLPLALLLAYVYPTRKLDELREELASLNRIIDHFGSEGYRQHRREKLLLQISRYEDLVYADGGQEMGPTGVAREVNEQASNQNMLDALATPFQRGAFPRVTVGQRKRVKAVLLLAVVQLCTLTPSFHFYWVREPVATDLEIYLFLLPIILVVAGTFLTTAFLIGVPIAMLLLTIIFFIVLEIPAKLLFICLDRERAREIHAAVNGFTDKVINGLASLLPKQTE